MKISVRKHKEKKEDQLDQLLVSKIKEEIVGEDK